jgi:carboxyl-terminal processing protease
MLLIPYVASSADSKTMTPAGSQTKPTPSTQPFNPQECFERVWKMVDEKFWDPDFNGVDWNHMRDRYLPMAAQCRDRNALAVVINEMLGQLKTSHTGYYTPDDISYYVLLSMIEPDNPVKRCGIGIDAARIGDDYFIRALLVGAPQELRLGDRLISANGQTFHPIRSFRGMHNKLVTLRVQRHPDKPPFNLEVVPKLVSERTRVFRDATSSYSETYNGMKFGYVRLWWLFDSRVAREFPVIISNLVERFKSQGIILDLRNGFGGGYKSYLYQFFLPSICKTRNIGRNRIFKSESDSDLNARNVPLVVLINGGSRSGKELLAYCLKKTKRGLLVGETTAGFVSAGHPRKMPEDAMLYCCTQMIDVDGVRLEGKGVIPDIEVNFDIRYCNGVDPQLERGKQELVKMIRQGWKPPKLSD